MASSTSGRRTAVRRSVISALTLGVLTALGALTGTGAFAAATAALAPAAATVTLAPATVTAALARGAADRAVAQLASTAPVFPGPAPYVLLRHNGFIANLLDGVL